MENYDIVLEKYVGQKPELKLIEKELKKVINKINASYAPLKKRIESGDTSSILSFQKVMTNYQLNNLPETRKIEMLFKKLFGLKGFIMNWVTDSTINAYTIPKTLIFLDKSFKKDKIGHQSNANMTVNVTLFTGLITGANLNEKELLGIILHEIGHNFYNSVFHTIIYFNIVDYVNIESLILTIATLGVLDTIGFNTANFKVRKFIGDTLSRIPGYKVITTAIDEMTDITTAMLPSGGGFFERIKEDPKLLLTYINPMNMIFNYNVEKHADSFAADYGYGVYLGKGLEKLSKEENSLSSYKYKLPVIGTFYDFMDVISRQVSSLLSGYPTEQNRIKSLLDRMEKSLNDPQLDPRLKKELMQEISRFENYYYNEYLPMTEDPNKIRCLTFINRAVADKLFNGKMDLRELTLKLDPKAKAF